MGNRGERQLNRMLRSAKRRRWQIPLLLCLAILVTAGVAGIFHLPAIAKTYRVTELTCTAVPPQGEACAYFFVHIHNEVDCYDAEGNLVCPLPEIRPHRHTADCYSTSRELVCTIPESDGHRHTADCYTRVRGELICEESTEPVYNVDGAIIAEGHVHTDECYAWTEELSCGMEEGEGAHHHDDSCYETYTTLICDRPEILLHTHTEDCYETDADGNVYLVCGQMQVLEHVHGPECFTTYELDDGEPEAVFMEAEEQPEEGGNQEPETADDGVTDDSNPNPADDKPSDIDEAGDADTKDTTTDTTDTTTETNTETTTDTTDTTTDTTDTTETTTETTTDTTDQENQKAADDEALPAAEEPHTVTYTGTRGAEKGGMTALAEIPEGALDANAQLVLGDADESAARMLILKVVNEFAAEGEERDISSMLVMDIGFMSGEEPAVLNGLDPIRVTLRAAAIRGMSVPKLFHLTGGTAREVQDVLFDTEAGTVVFTSTTFSPFAIVELTGEDLADETAEETVGESMPAQSFTGATDGVIITVEAPEGAFPAGTTMVVSRVEMDYETLSNVTDAVESRGAQKVVTTQAVDISFFDANQNLIEPKLPIKVSMKSALVSESENVALVHLTETDTAETAENETPEAPATPTAEIVTDVQIVENPDEDNAIQFESNAFSVYVLVGTETITTRYLTADGQTYLITVTCGPEAMIPEGATLAVTEIPQDSEEYAMFLAQAQSAVNAGATAEEADSAESGNGNPDRVTVTTARFFDITILDAEGNPVEPAAPVDVKIEYMEPAETAENYQVVHFGAETEVLNPAISGTDGTASAFDFKANSFSVFGIVGTVIEKNVLASDGKNYKVTVTYGAETGIPEGAELEVSEILPPESDETIAGSEEPLDSSLYDEYVARTEDALGWAEGSASYVRLFDIKITDEYGNKIDIAAPVDVRIELADKDSSEEGLLGTQVVHFADGAEVPDVVQNLSFDETKTESEGMTLSFTAAGFSVYAIVDAPEPAVVEIDYVDSLEELAGQTGKEFYLSYGTPPKYFTNELNTNSAFIENTSSGQADGWYFEPTGVDNQYYIYTYVEGVKKYITNPSGNLAGLADTNGTKFDLEDAGNGKFYFKKAGASLWLQHSGSGSGIRFYTDKKNAANSQISIAYASSFVLPDDPYNLNGKTYGIAYHNDTATSAALTAEGVTTSGQQRLKGLDMLMRPDVLDHDGILLVAENSDIQEWTFQNVSEDKYYLTTTVDGVTKYLTINGNNVTLTDTPDETYSLIKAIPGTGANSGKWHLSVGNYSLTLPNSADNGFNGTTGTGPTTWMNLVEKSSFPEEDFTYYNAKKVSVSDTSQVPDKKQVIIYTRVWNDTKKKYEFFAIDHDGSLIPCYDTGDGIEWIGTNVNTALWELSEGTNPDGSLSYYYWLRNTQYGNTFITPQLSTDQVIYTSPGSDMQDFSASVNLNGRRYEENYTTIIRWDDDQYGYSGLKVENGHLVPCALSEAEDFYFAIMEEKQHAEDVTTVETVDSKAYGITMKMVDFNNDVQKYSTGNRDVVQTEVMGTPDGGAGMLSTCLDETTGYPVVKNNSNSLSQLFDSTQETEVNHLFLQNIYNESGYFEYDSTQNFAHLNPEDGTFTVYDQLGAITGDSEHKNTREHGQFMPYNDISPDKGYAIDKDGHIITNQTDVRANELPDTNARKGENLYLIGDNTKGMADTTGDGVDYFFGMELEASFTQTANGLDAWGHDIIFEFSGDDDFWLYVDGQLVLDLGGVHSAQVGSVNFRTGLITSSNGNSTLYNTFKNNYKDQHPEATDEEVNQYLDDIFERNEEGNYVFKDYTKHTMRMFYMERGAGASNLHMRFNLAAVKPGTVVLSKQLSGTNSGSNSLLEYPYQIYYTTTQDGGTQEHLLDNPSLVTYKDSSKQVKYEEHLTLEQQTYDSVFFLKAGESAVIDLPDNTIDYRIVECGISTATYDVVKANGETLTPTDTQNPGRKDYKTSLDTMTNRDTVLFDNHVKEGAMRTLSITKQLYDSNGQDRLHYDAAEGEQEDKTLFSYRLYLGNAFTSEDDIPPANLYSYFVKNRDGYYCRWDLAQKKFVSLGIRDYSVLETYLATLTDTQKESIIFKTSPSGAISKIPADYTVEVRDLIDGVHWKVEERDDEIPKGYTLRLSDGYTRTDIIPEEQHGTTPISDTITGVEDPKVDVRNQKGWGLTVQKVWTDEDFIDHDPIYFAVYYEKAEQAPELIEGSVRSMMNGNKEIYYFFNQEQMAGRDFSEYRVYEVKLTNPEIDPQTGEIRYDSITPIPDNGQLTVVGRPKGTTESHEYEYTVTYQIGEPTTQNENVRTDVVTNSRPGIKLFKMLWNYTDPLAGSVFTLKDSKGQDVAAESYTSRSEDGLITIAYLNPGIYTLTEVETPKGYVVLPEPITITVAQDGTISVPVPNQYYKFTPAHEATETPEAEMATVTIRNRTTELHVKKVDAVTKDPLAGAHFALYNQVTDAQGNKRKDYQPITGYENLISNAEGILTFPDTNVEAVTIENLTWGNTYYLTETQAVTDYDLLKEDLCFTVNKDGTITIENAEHSGWLTTSTDTDKGKYSSLIQIPNGKLQYVSVWKTDDGYTTITTGASFALYKAEDYDDAAGRPKEGAVPVLTGTTGANGILALGTLPAGTEYRLVETKAPDGYYPPTSAIKIFVNADKVTAMQAGSPAKVFRKGDEHWVPDQPEATWQIRVWNSQGYALPSTGGPGTNLIYLIGLMLTGIAGAGLVMRKRRRT